MADCEYQIGGKGKFYSESEFKKLLSEGYLDKVMMEKSLTIKGIKPNEAIASSFQLPSAIQPTVPVTEVKTEEVVTPTGDKNNYKIAQDVTAEVSKENPDASVLLTPKGEDLSLTAVYVGKENRGKGIGTKVLESVKKQADKLGKKIVLDATTELDEETDLGRLESFYQKNGFTKVGENKFEYNPTAEVKAEEVVTPAETVTEEKSFDDRVAEEFAKTWRKYSFEENPKETIDVVKNEIKYANLYDNGEISAKEYLEATRSADEKFGTGSGDKSISELSDEELKTFANTSFLNENINKAKQKVQSQPVTKTEEKVTEPTANVETLRAEEQKELAEAIPNIESYKVDDKIDKSLMTPEESTSYDEIYNKYDKLITPLLKEPAAKTAPETKQPTKEAQVAKSLADTLRKAKMNLPKGTAMASFAPGFDKVWDTTIETVAKAIEVGGVTAGNFRQSINDGMKALRNTDAYKAITDPKERAKISSQYRKALVDLVPQHFDFNADNLRAAEFDTFNEELEAAKGRDLDPKALNALKAKAKKFVNDNLPVDNYRKTEVKSYVAKNFDKAKNVADIQKNLEAVNALLEGKEAKMAEKSKEKLISEVESIIANNSRKVVSVNRRTGAKKGKVTISAQQQVNQIIQDLKDRGLFKNLDKLSKQELIDLKENLDNIVKTGKSEQKQLTVLDEVKKRTDKAMIFKALARKSDDVLNGKEEIIKKFEKENGYVIVDDQLMSSSDFKKFASLKENKDIELNNIPFYYKVNLDDVKGKIEKEKVIRRAIRGSSLFNIEDLESHVKKIGAGSPELKKWLEEEIMKPIREGERREIESNWRLTKEYLKETKKIFGTYDIATKDFFKDKIGAVKEFAKSKLKTKTVKVSKMYDTLAAPTGITPKNSEESISADQAVVLYNIMYNTNTDINNEFKLDPKIAEKDMKTLMRENYISPEEVYNFMHKPENKALLEYAHLLSGKYNVQARQMFGPVIEQFHNIALGNDYYHPHLRSGSALETNNIIDPNKSQNFSILAPSMRHKEDNASAPFKLIGANELYLNYVKSMTHAKEFIPVVKSAYTLLSDVNKPYIMEKLGSESDYNDLIQALSNTVGEKLPFQSGPISGLTNYTSLTLLWFRVKSIEQQMSSMIHYYTAGIKDGVNPWDIAAAVPLNKDELKFSAKFYSDNPYLWTRLSGGNITPEMQKLKEQTDSLSNKLVKGTINFSQFAGLLGIKGGDFLAAASPGGGMSFALAQFKKKFKETGDYQLSRDHAIQRWFEETERTGQVSMAREIMSTKSFDPLARLFIPFSSAQQGIGKKIYKSYLDLKDFPNLNKKEKAQAIADIIYYPLISPLPFLLSGSGGYAIYQMLFDDEEDKISDAEKKRVFYDLMADAAQSHATALGLPGLIFNFSMNVGRDKSSFNEAPSYQRLTDIGTELVSLLRANKTWDDLSASERKSFIKDYTKENGSLGGKNVEEIYNNTFFNEKQIDLLLKSAGFKNLKDLATDVEEVSKDGDFLNFLTGIETKNNEENKKLIPYFNHAVKYNKKDEVYESLERFKRTLKGGDYKPEEYIPEGGEKAKKSRRSSSKPGAFPKQKFGPKIPKFKIN